MPRALRNLAKHFLGYEKQANQIDVIHPLDTHLGFIAEISASNSIRQNTGNLILDSDTAMELIAKKTLLTFTWPSQVVLIPANPPERNERKGSLISTALKADGISASDDKGMDDEREEQQHISASYLGKSLWQWDLLCTEIPLDGVESRAGVKAYKNIRYVPANVHAERVAAICLQEKIDRESVIAPCNLYSRPVNPWITNSHKLLARSNQEPCAEINAYINNSMFAASCFRCPTGDSDWPNLRRPSHHTEKVFDDMKFTRKCKTVDNCDGKLLPVRSENDRQMKKSSAEPNLEADRQENESAFSYYAVDEKIMQSITSVEIITEQREKSVKDVDIIYGRELNEFKLLYCSPSLRSGRRLSKSAIDKMDLGNGGMTRGSPYGYGSLNKISQSSRSPDLSLYAFQQERQSEILKYTRNTISDVADGRYEEAEVGLREGRVEPICMSAGNPGLNKSDEWRLEFGANPSLTQSLVDVITAIIAEDATYVACVGDVVTEQVVCLRSICPQGQLLNENSEEMSNEAATQTEDIFVRSEPPTAGISSLDECSNEVATVKCRNSPNDIEEHHHPDSHPLPGPKIAGTRNEAVELREESRICSEQTSVLQSSELLLEDLKVYSSDVNIFTTVPDYSFQLTALNQMETHDQLTVINKPQVTSQYAHSPKIHSQDLKIWNSVRMLPEKRNCLRDTGVCFGPMDISNDTLSHSEGLDLLNTAELKSKEVGVKTTEDLVEYSSILAGKPRSAAITESKSIESEYGEKNCQQNDTFKPYQNSDQMFDQADGGLAYFNEAVEGLSENDETSDFTAPELMPGRQTITGMSDCARFSASVPKLFITPSWIANNKQRKCRISRIRASVSDCSVRDSRPFTQVGKSVCSSEDDLAEFPVTRVHVLDIGPKISVDFVQSKDRGPLCLQEEAEQAALGFLTTEKAAKLGKKTETGDATEHSELQLLREKTETFSVEERLLTEMQLTKDPNEGEEPSGLSQCSNDHIDCGCVQEQRVSVELSLASESELDTLMIPKMAEEVKQEWTRTSADHLDAWKCEETSSSVHASNKMPSKEYARLDRQKDIEVEHGIRFKTNGQEKLHKRFEEPAVGDVSEESLQDIPVLLSVQRQEVAVDKGSTGLTNSANVLNGDFVDLLFPTALWLRRSQFQMGDRVPVSLQKLRESATFNNPDCAVSENHKLVVPAENILRDSKYNQMGDCAQESLLKTQSATGVKCESVVCDDYLLWSVSKSRLGSRRVKYASITDQEADHEHSSPEIGYEYMVMPTTPAVHIKNASQGLVKHPFNCAGSRTGESRLSTYRMEATRPLEIKKPESELDSLNECRERIDVRIEGGLSSTPCAAVDGNLESRNSNRTKAHLDVPSSKSPAQTSDYKCNQSPACYEHSDNSDKMQKKRRGKRSRGQRNVEDELACAKLFWEPKEAVSIVSDILEKVLQNVFNLPETVSDEHKEADHCKKSYKMKSFLRSLMKRKPKRTDKEEKQMFTDEVLQYRLRDGSTPSAKHLNESCDHKARVSFPAVSNTADSCQRGDKSREANSVNDVIWEANVLDVSQSHCKRPDLSKWEMTQAPSLSHPRTLKSSIEMPAWNAEISAESILAQDSRQLKSQSSYKVRPTGQEKDNEKSIQPEILQKPLALSDFEGPLCDIRNFTRLMHLSEFKQISESGSNLLLKPEMTDDRKKLLGLENTQPTSDADFYMMSRLEFASKQKRSPANLLNLDNSQINQNRKSEHIGPAFTTPFSLTNEETNRNEMNSYFSHGTASLSFKVDKQGSQAVHSYVDMIIQQAQKTLTSLPLVKQSPTEECEGEQAKEATRPCGAMLQSLERKSLVNDVQERNIPTTGDSYLMPDVGRCSPGGASLKKSVHVGKIGNLGSIADLSKQQISSELPVHEIRFEGQPRKVAYQQHVLLERKKTQCRQDKRTFGYSGRSFQKAVVASKGEISHFADISRITNQPEKGHSLISQDLTTTDVLCVDSHQRTCDIPIKSKIVGSLSDTDLAHIRNIVCPDRHGVSIFLFKPKFAFGTRLLKLKSRLTPSTFNWVCTETLNLKSERNSFSNLKMQSSFSDTTVLKQSHNFSRTNGNLHVHSSKPANYVRKSKSLLSRIPKAVHHLAKSSKKTVSTAGSLTSSDTIALGAKGNKKFTITSSNVQNHSKPDRQMNSASIVQLKKLERVSKQSDISRSRNHSRLPGIPFDHAFVTEDSVAPVEECADHFTGENSSRRSCRSGTLTKGKAHSDFRYSSLCSAEINSNYLNCRNFPDIKEEPWQTDLAADLSGSQEFIPCLSTENTLKMERVGSDSLHRVQPHLKRRSRSLPPKWTRSLPSETFQRNDFLDDVSSSTLTTFSNGDCLSIFWEANKELSTSSTCTITESLDSAFSPPGRCSEQCSAYDLTISSSDESFLRKDEIRRRQEELELEDFVNLERAVLEEEEKNSNDTIVSCLETNYSRDLSKTLPAVWPLTSIPEEVEEFQNQRDDTLECHELDVSPPFERPVGHGSEESTMLWNAVSAVSKSSSFVPSGDTQQLFQMDLASEFYSFDDEEWRLVDSIRSVRHDRGSKLDKVVQFHRNVEVAGKVTGDALLDRSLFSDGDTLFGRQRLPLGSQISTAPRLRHPLNPERAYKTKSSFRGPGTVTDNWTADDVPPFNAGSFNRKDKPTTVLAGRFPYSKTASTVFSTKIIKPPATVGIASKDFLEMNRPMLSNCLATGGTNCHSEKANETHFVWRFTGNSPSQHAKHSNAEETGHFANIKPSATHKASELENSNFPSESEDEYAKTLESLHTSRNLGGKSRKSLSRASLKRDVDLNNFSGKLSGAGSHRGPPKPEQSITGHESELQQTSKRIPTKLRAHVHTEDQSQMIKLSKEARMQCSPKESKEKVLQSAVKSYPHSRYTEQNAGQFPAFLRSVTSSNAKQLSSSQFRQASRTTAEPKRSDVHDLYLSNSEENLIAASKVKGIRSTDAERVLSASGQSSHINSSRTLPCVRRQYQYKRLWRNEESISQATVKNNSSALPCRVPLHESVLSNVTNWDKDASIVGYNGKTASLSVKNKVAAYPDKSASHNIKSHWMEEKQERSCCRSTRAQLAQSEVATDHEEFRKSSVVKQARNVAEKSLSGYSSLSESSDSNIADRLPSWLLPKSWQSDAKLRMRTQRRQGKDRNEKVNSHTSLEEYSEHNLPVKEEVDGKGRFNTSESNNISKVKTKVTSSVHGHSRLKESLAGNVEASHQSMVSNVRLAASREKREKHRQFRRWEKLSEDSVVLGCGSSSESVDEESNIITLHGKLLKLLSNAFLDFDDQDPPERNNSHDANSIVDRSPCLDKYDAGSTDFSSAGGRQYKICEEYGTVYGSHRSAEDELSPESGPWDCLSETDGETQSIKRNPSLQSCQSDHDLELSSSSDSFFQPVRNQLPSQHRSSTFIADERVPPSRNLSSTASSWQGIPLHKGGAEINTSSYMSPCWSSSSSSDCSSQGPAADQSDGPEST